TKIQELDNLKDWNRKVQRKNRRMEGRLASLERGWRETHRERQSQEQSESVPSLTMELHSQMGHLKSLEVQREQLLVGLKSVQDSLKEQDIRISRVEGRLEELLQGNGISSQGSTASGDPITSNIPPQGPAPVWRTQTSTGQSPRQGTQTQAGNTQIQGRGQDKPWTVCNVDSMLLFPSASSENYVTFTRSFPALPEVSMCLWLRVDVSYVGTLLSYATEDNDNKLVLYGSSSASSSSTSTRPTLDFVVGDPAYRELPVDSVLDGRWHHLCVLWSSIEGRFWHYTDRRLTSAGSRFRKGYEVSGGGSVVLGAEQDKSGGGFDPAEGFVGRLAGFMVWDRVLSPGEVTGVATGKGVPRGMVLGLRDVEGVYGGVQQVACQCLEHCS
uniref:Pentraxin (PTX) domain-containing protein n=1 Tax=Esox lucius TaxID=8010 RepID=A0A3P9A173_ESOLU